jgi:hypothetical protein
MLLHHVGSRWPDPGHPIPERIGVLVGTVSRRAVGLACGKPPSLDGFHVEAIGADVVIQAISTGCEMTGHRSIGCFDFSTTSPERRFPRQLKQTVPSTNSYGEVLSGHCRWALAPEGRFHKHPAQITACQSKKIIIKPDRGIARSVRKSRTNAKSVTTDRRRPDDVKMSGPICRSPTSG